MCIAHSPSSLAADTAEGSATYAQAMGLSYTGIPHIKQGWKQWWQDDEDPIEQGLESDAEMVTS